MANFIDEEENDFISVIREEMEQRLISFSDPKPVSIFCGTWNLNDRIFPSESNPDSARLKDWLIPPGLPQIGYDLYVVAFQETVHLSTYNVVFSDESITVRAPYWQSAIEESLGLVQTAADDPYVFLTGRHLVGLLLIIYTKKSLVPFISNLRVCSVPLGVMGILGNKGAISVRFNLYYDSLCFIASHFHPNREAVAARNADFQTVMEKTLFTTETHAPGTWSSTITVQPPVVASSSGITSLGGGGGEGTKVGTEMPKDFTSNPLPASRPSTRKTPLNEGESKIESNIDPSSSPSSSSRWKNEEGEELIIDDHNFIFWLGDLNYRIDSSLSTEAVFAEVDNLPLLRDKDQLNIERARGAVFNEFSEAPLTFPPTYKFEPGTFKYDTRAEKKLRAPAWCDRILWKTSHLIDPASIENICYFSAPMLLSDHIPVGALFNCQCRKIDIAKEKSAYSVMPWKYSQPWIAGRTLNSPNWRSQTRSSTLEMWLSTVDPRPRESFSEIVALLGQFGH